MAAKLRFFSVFLLAGLTLALTWLVAAQGATANGVAADLAASASQTNAAPSHAVPLNATDSFTVYLPCVTRDYMYFWDNFSDPNSGWTSGDDSSRAWGYLGGEYQILLKATDAGWFVTPDLVMPSSYRVEVDARLASSGSGAYGLMFGVRLSGNAYESYQVIIYPTTQEYLVNKRSMDGTWTTLIDWAYNAVINPGTASNHLRVDRIGDSIHIYINGILVATYSDSSFTGAGRDAGVRAWSYDTAPVDVRFDNFKATNVSLVNPLYQENFSVSGRWYTDDTADIRYSYQSGEYEILLRNADWWGGVRAPLKGGLTNYAVEADMRFPDSNLGGYGLNFGQIDWDRFYNFAVYPGDQQYGLWKHTASGWSTLLGSTFSSYINAGTATNHLKVERRGSEVKLYVNGHLLTTVSDSSYLGNLPVALYADSLSLTPVTARFDNFSFSELGVTTTMQTSPTPSGVTPADSREFSHGPAR